ncbi:predicted protein [Naegleria gruberi]|uniref:Predicted protein n=1 Tax=Naegleria gruberi TaxID=5762 RepID=D2VSV8_NAEGR|nr:uncharacterized protein NAEGRDRAFT_51991 [Naegleria gruberi]EFC40048.1 predicted protein [Naegleria gruberi]|eukprot:XP_002672792.1 predicted protein [Naegleria gruberi strain NEG-M]
MTGTIRGPISLSALVSQEFNSVHHHNERRKSSASSQIVDYSYGGIEMLDSLESIMFAQLYDLLVMTFHLVIGLGKIIVELGWSSFQFLTSSIVYFEVDTSIYSTSPHIATNRRHSDGNNDFRLTSSPSDDLNISLSLQQDRRKSSLFDIPLMDIDAIIERVANELAEIIHQALHPTSSPSLSNVSNTGTHNKMEKTLSMQVIEPASSHNEDTVPLSSMLLDENACDSLDKVQLKARLNQFVFPFFSPSK